MHEFSPMCRQDVRIALADRQIRSMIVDKATIQTIEPQNSLHASQHETQLWGFFGLLSGRCLIFRQCIQYEIFAFRLEKQQTRDIASAVPICELLEQCEYWRNSAGIFVFLSKPL